MIAAPQSAPVPKGAGAQAFLRFPHPDVQTCAALHSLRKGAAPKIKNARNEKKSSTDATLWL